MLTLTICTAATDRDAERVKLTYLSVLQNAGAHRCVLVNCGCPQLDTWARTHLDQPVKSGMLQYAYIHGASCTSAAYVNNVAHRLARTDIIARLDPGHALETWYADEVIRIVRFTSQGPDRSIIVPVVPLRATRLAIGRNLFHTMRGYSEHYSYGESHELVERAVRNGADRLSIDGEWAECKIDPPKPPAPDRLAREAMLNYRRANPAKAWGAAWVTLNFDVKVSV